MGSFGDALRIFTFENKEMFQLSRGLGRGENPAVLVTLVAVSSCISPAVMIE